MKHTLKWSAAVVIGVAVSVATLRATAVPTTTSTASDRYSTQTVVLPGLLGAVVTVTDHQTQKLHFYRVESEALLLHSTIDLTSTGAAEIAITKPPTTRPTTVPATAPIAKVPEAKPTRVVSVEADGMMRTSSFAVPAGDLPQFAEKFTKGHQVIVTGGNVRALSQLVEARDRLRAAGVEDVVLSYSPGDPEEKYSRNVPLTLWKNGSLTMKGQFQIKEADFALFQKEIVGDRAIKVDGNDSSIPLSELVKASDRLKAAGMERVRISGQTE